MFKRVSVIREDKNGRNMLFRDNLTKEKMTIPKFVQKIEHKKYEDYHVRVIHGKKTPCANPDKSENNNLG